MKKQELKNQILLNKRFDKSYCLAMYSLFLEKDKGKSQTIFDPFYNKNIEICKSQSFIMYWRLYFNTLFVLLKKNTSYTNAEICEHIHLIFGNTFHQTEVSWFLLPSTTIDVGFSYLDNQMEKHKNYILEKNTYGIQHE